MKRTIRLHVTIDAIHINGAELAQRYALGPLIQAHLKAILQETGVDFQKPHQCRFDVVRTAPLAYKSRIRPAQLGRNIARQVIHTMAAQKGRAEPGAGIRGVP
jgi:hypothetical protein